ncbi:hypothetical protein [Rivularia sp. UHCC 0363]|uniref:hypothetical protein n=1 Tax=Rivularia sp. UHCC 0363 TaxID=3110244 RepID=UPI002B1F3DA5|nr:hypothetical protein [Rivularia sp. UHCC 0363]MEA5594770.1 hypothetical protein [Rivularia sp. UHCC 0363]
MVSVSVGIDGLIVIKSSNRQEEAALRRSTVLPTLRDRPSRARADCLGASPYKPISHLCLTKSMPTAYRSINTFEEKKMHE